LLVLSSACHGAEQRHEAAAPSDGDTSDAAANEPGPSGERDADPSEESATSQPEAGAAPRLPPVPAGFDYQLGGAYAPPAGVKIVARDRTASPAPSLYNICYVNGFQSQPDEADFWLKQQPDLVLRDTSGKPVIDPDWDEMLLDITSADKRARLAAIVGGWIAGCAKAGFDAVEIDNLDTYTRSNKRIREDDAVAFVKLLSAAAHAEGLAIAQKNSAEIVARRAEMGTDFAVSEECNRYSECQMYTAGYGAQVLVIEYRRADFETGCSRYPQLSIVLRDLQLSPPGAGYVFERCK
jgi:hypothetical protein